MVVLEGEAPPLAQVVVVVVYQDTMVIMELSHLEEMALVAVVVVQDLEEIEMVEEAEMEVILIMEREDKAVYLIIVKVVDAEQTGQMALMGILAIAVTMEVWGTI